MAAFALTERQRDVLALLGRGLSEKEIASELGISPSRVTQHVRALKDRLGTERRSGLVAAATQLPLYEKATGDKIPVPSAFDFGEPATGAVPDQVTVSDAMPLRHPAPWESDAYRVGPGAFDDQGENLRRLLLMIKVSLGVPALIVILIIARWAITAAATSPP